MNNLTQQKDNKAVATWILIGVGMIMVQVLLGGITRLTESGLSITEWKPITGALPPLNDIAWQAEFDKYKGTDQFKYVHQDFSLSDFKFIFFWEWFHRVWARLMGLVLVAGFVYFIAKKKLTKAMVLPLAILLVFGGIQGAIGWLMVKSGLVPEKYFVGHVELTTHLVAALILLSYALWFALSLLVVPGQLVINKPLKHLLLLIVSLLFVQLVYGGFMAGLKAATAAITWPDINGQLMPASMNELSPWQQNLVNNKIMIHFIHRGIAYLLLIVIAYWWFASRTIKAGKLFSWLRNGALLVVLLQVVLGILTVLNATYSTRLVWLGVAHQFTAMLLLMIVISLLYVVRKKGYSVV